MSHSSIRLVIGLFADENSLQVMAVVTAMSLLLEAGFDQIFHCLTHGIADEKVSFGIGIPMVSLVRG